METTLHKQLKDHYSTRRSQLEVRVDGFIIDIVDGKRLIEIQRSGLSSIRSKIQKLLSNEHKVEVVKPLVVRKLSLIHISEPTRLLSISYAVFCLKKKKK